MTREVYAGSTTVGRLRLRTTAIEREAKRPQLAVSRRFVGAPIGRERPSTDLPPPKKRTFSNAT